MTAPSTTPPLEEREAVARTDIVDVRNIDVECHGGMDIVDALYDAWNKLPICSLLSVVSGGIQELQALRTENETLRAQWEEMAELVCEFAAGQAHDAVELVGKDRDQCLKRALRAEAERDAAIARAEEAERTTDQVRTAMVAKHQEAWRQINTISAELAQAKAQVAGMRVPDGYRVLPVNPTTEMVRALAAAVGGSWDIGHYAWERGVASAPITPLISERPHGN